MQQPFGEDFARRIVEVQEAITDAMRPVVEAVARFEAQWRDVAARLPPPESILRLVETVAEGGRLALQRGLPANWRELDLADWERALRLGTEHGISVIWAPRVEIVRELIGAETEAERDRVLVEHRERILGDLESPLREATYDRFGHGPSMAWQALGALRDGHYAPAQSHAAAALTQLVHDNLGHAQLHDARRAFEQHDPMHVEMGMFRITALLRTLARALHRTDDARPGFNRHASAHGVATAQYSEANALAAMLLLVGLLRELQFVFALMDDDANAERQAQVG